jgi:hypothetical protein
MTHGNEKRRRQLEAKHLCREKPILRTIMDYLAANMTWTFHFKKLDTSNIIKLVIIDEE